MCLLLCARHAEQDASQRPSGSMDEVEEPVLRDALESWQVRGWVGGWVGAQQELRAWQSRGVACVRATRRRVRDSPRHLCNSATLAA